MAQHAISSGPAVSEIFFAAQNATNPSWSPLLDFTIDEKRFRFSWVNELTWMGEHSEHLKFKVKFGDNTYVVEYDTRDLTGTITEDRGSTDLFEEETKFLAALRAVIPRMF